MPPEVADLVTLVGPLATALIVALYSFYKGWIVPGYVYRSTESALAAEQAKNAALYERVIDVTGRMTALLERAQHRNGGGVA